MKYLLLILLASGLHAKGDEVKTREFQVRDSVGIEVFRDKNPCCPEVGNENLVGDDIKLFNAIRKMMAVKKVEILSATIFYDKHNLPEKFNVESPNLELPVGAPDGGRGRSCCVWGSIHTKFDEGGGVSQYQVVASSSAYGWDEDSPWEDHEMMRVSRVSIVKEKIWQHHVGTKDSITDFINSHKEIIDFKISGEEIVTLFYLSKVTRDKIDSVDESYNFDRQDEVLSVWSEPAAKVFHAYWDGSQEESNDEVTGMTIYKKWLAIHTDAKGPGRPSSMSDYYLKRIKRKWVVVYDGHAMTDPRFGGWVPKKVDEKQPGITEADIPKALRHQ